MAKEHIKIIDSEIQIQAALLSAHELIIRGLPGGAVDLVVRRHEEIRTDLQNSKEHCMMIDIREQAVIKTLGKRIIMKSYSMDAAKALLVIWYATECELMGEPLRHPPETVLCPITGKEVTLRPSTTKFLKAENIGFIEWLYALGGESGVKWSEKALAQYETYRQAQNK